MRPGDGGGKPPNADAASPALPERTTRMLEGKLEDVGVAGRTLTDVWGLRPIFMEPEVGEVMEMEAEDVEEALEWLW